MRIVLAEDGLIELHHLHSCDAESTTFKTIHDFTNQLTLYAAGLQKY